MNPKYAASYARKSDADDLGIKDQHKLNAQAALRDGYHIPPGAQFHFEDDDTTGASTSRKGLDRLQQTAESGQAPFTRIYVKDRSRLGRFENPKRSAYLEVLFEDCSTPLFFAQSMMGPSTGRPEHRMAEAISATIEAVSATQAREDIIRRTIAGVRSRVCRGRFPLTVAPYATERWLFDEATQTDIERIEPGRSIQRAGCTYVLRPGPVIEQEVVRSIFARILDGEAFQSIAKALNQQGIPAPRSGRRTGDGWTGAKIVDLARNPIYMGDLVFGRTTLSGEPVDHLAARIEDTTPIRVQGIIPAIVSQEIWEAAQTMLNGKAKTYRARRGSQPIYALSGLLRCVNCGAPYTGFTSTRFAKIRNRYYRHDHRLRTDGPANCPARNRYIRADALESKVTSLLQQLVTDPALQHAVAAAFDRDRELAAGPKLTQEKARLTRERDTLAAKINRLISMRLEDESADAAAIVHEVTAEHGARKQFLEQALLDLEGAHRAWDVAQRSRKVPGGAELISKALEQATNEERRKIIHEAVATIRVDADLPDVEVVFHTLQDLRSPTTPPASPPREVASSHKGAS